RKTLLLVFLLIHISSAVKHFLKFFYTGTSGLSNFPEFVGSGVLDRIPVGYCNTNIKIVESKEVKKFHLYTIVNYSLCFCLAGVHVLQEIDGCDWEDETGDINSFRRYGYNGEDIKFDLKTLTQIALKPQRYLPRTGKV
uniref:Uncharacterized protein n=1 Tax=Mola mola TaxID=94237 RepID=A0A3Q4B6G0_MOLML